MFNLTLIGTLGGPNSRAFAIDISRQVAGDSTAAPNGDVHAMFFDGQTQDLGVLSLPNPFGIPGLPNLDLSSARAIGRLASGTTLVAGSSSAIVFPAAVVNRATFWINNVPQDMGTLIPGPAFAGMFLGNSEALGANQQGLIVGVSDIAALGTTSVIAQRAFVFNTSIRTMQVLLPTLFPDPAGSGAFFGNSKALGINDHGQIVGVSDTADVNPDGSPVRHAFLFDSTTGVMTDLGTLISRMSNPAQTNANSEARAINNRGQIVGVSDSLDANSAPVQRAFLFDPGGFSGRRHMDLGTLNPANRPVSFFVDLGNSEANAINNRGDIVGTADTGQVDVNGEPIRRGFIFDGTRPIQDLNATPLPAGWTITEATGINDNGDICGFGVDGSGSTRGLLLLP
jgi:probable HAF family extracellular repeat protein